ncbi:broad-complex core protein isoforms 1/2/3/4/5-like isoform X2 [Amphibalanus amphitrite]|uniref:broad-complex core protein isoforms 1/2/3/4/5-like isoform X2 n=1 Tax=Amphibalanus amphitrite TaxID=1232801 RepID=UPI001C900C5F|nr:broad-complex core protein isoforms 1/2/3/4/5-like isoform X2 [Amphibalanus amphitrite]
MSEQQEFCLRWNDFHSSFHLSLEALRGDESFTDVTLSCSGRLMRAHRVILSACSVHFKEILRAIPPQQHPVIVLPTVDYDVMQAILEFIYQGQVNVRQSQLGAFLQVAETFSIQGLADDETKRNAAKTPARSRPADSEPPAPKRRRAEPVPARSQSPPAADAAAVAVSPSAERRPEPAAQPADKTVNISVSIKAEGMSDTMVGELLEHSQSAPMLDPDMEPGGSDVVAQAMATMGHESGDTSANELFAGLMESSPPPPPPPLLASPLSPSASLPSLAASAPRRNSSLIWAHFVRWSDRAQCRYCGRMLQRGASATTSSLWTHLSRIHGIERGGAPLAAHQLLS